MLTTTQTAASIATGHPRRLDALDAVRGLAASVVFVHHALLTQPVYSDYFFSGWRTPANGWLSNLLLHSPLRIVWSGYEAVILFYVLSGLVLTLPYVKGRPPTLTDFWVRRACRIYLPYAAAIVLASYIDVLLSPSPAIAGLSDWVNQMNWTNPITAYVVFDHLLLIGHHNVIDGPIHSLIWEMRVSIVFPLLMLPVARRGIWGALLLWADLIGIILAAQLGFGDGRPGLLASSPSLGPVGKLVLEVQWTAYYACFFVAGSMLSIMLLPVCRWLGRHRAAGPACLLLGLLMLQAHWSRLAPIQDCGVAAAAVLVLIAALSPGRIEAVLTSRPLLFMGRISYSFYLVHVPIILLTLTLLHDRFSDAVLLGAAAVLSVAAGYVFHVRVAEPCARLGKMVTTRMLAPARQTV